MMPQTGRNARSVLTNCVKVRLLTCLVFALVGSFACIGAHAQKVAPSNMTFVCTPDPIYVGASATCTAHLVGNGYPITGSVSLYLGSLLLQTIPLDSNGDAVATTATFGPGPGIYVVTAVYSGDDLYLPTQRDMALTVYSGQVIVTAETLVCSPYLAYGGNPISCKMHLPGGTTGTVNFTIAGNAWATATVDPNGDAVVVNGLQGAGTGDYRITAIYSGDSNFAPATASTTAVAVWFKPQPNAMSVGCSPATFTVGTSNESCTVHVGGGATGSVDLYVHDQYLTTAQLDNSGSATVANVFTGLASGAYAIRAVYTGDANFDSASAATTMWVYTEALPINLVVVCTPEVLNPGSGTNCTARAPAGATGNILFYIAGNYWTTIPLDGNGRATVSSGLSNFPVGNYAVVAYYSGDQDFTSTSAGTTVYIQQFKPVTNVDVSCSPAVLVSGGGTTCTATVGGPQIGATGPVLFGLPGQPTSGLTIDPNGTVVFENQLAGVPSGSYTLQATYLGDINFSGSSNTTTVTVSSEKSTPIMTASISPMVIRSGDAVTASVNVGGGATGSVELLLNGYHYVTMPLDSTGSFVVAEHIVTTPENGFWNLSFIYSGDANYSSVTKTTQLTAITNPLTLSCSPSTISSGSSTSCTAQVAGVTTGTISVYVDGALQGTSGVDQSGTVVLAVPPTSLPSGTRTVTASYFLDDQTLAGTASQSISVTPGSTQSGYSYSITDSNSNSGYAANGNVVTYTDSVNGQWALGYDSLNRLTSAATGANNYCWAYDSFGNRTAQGVQSAPCPAVGLSIPSNWLKFAVSAGNQLLGTLDSNNNIVLPYSYDTAGNIGNMTIVQGDNNILSAVLYDGEGRVCATRQPILSGLYRQTQYVYDAEGNRVAEGMITDWSKGCDLTQNGFQQTKAFIVGPSGDQMTEMSVDANGNISWVHTNVYAKNTLIATYTNDNGAATPQTGPLHFVLSDWQGNKRVQTTYDGTTENTWANLPFGDGLQNCDNCSGGGDASEQHFTGKERDQESGLDYFGARYYSSSIGRWMSPDWAAKPEAVPYSSLDNPQSLNLYGYVNNNPLSKVDADGHCPECITAEGFFGAEVGSVLGPVGAVVGAGVAILAGTHPDAVADIISNGRPPSYVPGGSLTDENGNSIFMSNKSGTANASATTDSANTGPKAANAPGVTAGGQATDEHGNKLGPSGKPQVNTTQSSTRKGADDKAKSEGSGSVEHSNPKVGKPHFHPTDADGNKKPTSTHHEYPDK